MNNQSQVIEQAKGRAMLTWAGKRPLDKVEYFPAQEKEVYGDTKAKEFNKLFWGDNLQVLAHLLKEYRGKVDLIYIDPPFNVGSDFSFTALAFSGNRSQSQNNKFEFIHLGLDKMRGVSIRRSIGRKS